MYPEICPKCAHILSSPATRCPHCGVIFAKYARAEAIRRQERQQPHGGFVRQRLLQAKQGENNIVIGIRFVFLTVLTLYGLKLILTPIVSLPNTGWLLHATNLVFHEAGHLFFSPFGRFMQVLGGTLGQLIIPAVVIGSFLWQRDAFGAAVGTWWLGESFWDIAPYINDARAGQLLLLGGVTGSEVEGYHDWQVLLSRLDMMRYDHLFARIAFSVGAVLMLAAILWGSYLLGQSWRTRSRI